MSALYRKQSFAKFRYRVSNFLSGTLICAARKLLFAKFRLRDTADAQRRIPEANHVLPIPISLERRKSRRKHLSCGYIPVLDLA